MVAAKATSIETTIATIENVSFINKLNHILYIH